MVFTVNVRVQHRSKTRQEVHRFNDLSFGEEPVRDSIGYC